MTLAKKKTKKGSSMKHMTLAKITPSQTSHTPEIDEEIRDLRNQLQDLYTSWHEDGCMPPNYIRRDGLGKIVAEVNVWCGGFQASHKPKVVGWRAQLSNRLNDGVILVGKRERDSVIQEAMKIADDALENLWSDGIRNGGGWEHIPRHRHGNS